MYTFADISGPVGDFSVKKQAKGIDNKRGDLSVVRDLMLAIPQQSRGFNHVPQVYSPARKFAEAIERFQEVQFGISCGRMEPGNVTITALNRLAAKQAGEDPNAVKGPRGFNKEAMVAIHAHFVSRLRQGIIDEASKYLGQVNSGSGPHGVAGKKPGAELLWRIHAETLEPVPHKAKGEVMAIGRKPWSWWGIYAVWCTKNVLARMGSQASLHWSQGKGIFRAGSKMEPISISRPDQLGKGDICVVNETGSDGSFPNHHVMVAEDTPGARFQTVEGNYWDPAKRVDQSIVKNERGISEILQAYRVPEFLDPIMM